MSVISCYSPKIYSKCRSCVEGHYGLSCGCTIRQDIITITTWVAPSATEPATLGSNLCLSSVSMLGSQQAMVKNEALGILLWYAGKEKGTSFHHQNFSGLSSKNYKVLETMTHCGHGNATAMQGRTINCSPILLFQQQTVQRPLTWETFWNPW